jgi:hypothetical protein
MKRKMEKLDSIIIEFTNNNLKRVSFLNGVA